MRNKKIAVLASAAIVAGFFLLSRGTLLLVSAQVEPNIDPSKIVGISVDNNKVLFHGMNITNIAPGDNGQDFIVVRNTGTATEMVTITTTPSGEIFADNGKTGNSLGAEPDPDENNTVHGISMDYAAYGNDKMFKFDNHPMQISYEIIVDGLLTAPIDVGPFSNGNAVSQFQLGAGKTATVTYNYNMPIHAHNDYQATQGQLDIALEANGPYTPPPPPENNTPDNNIPAPPENNTPNNSPPPVNNTPNNTPSPPPPPNNPPGGGPGRGSVPGGTTPVTGLPFISIVMEALLAVILGGGLVALSRGKSNKS